MPKVSCGKCARSFNAPENALGKIAKCPNCSAPIKIEGHSLPSKPSIDDVIASSNTAGNVSLPSSTTSEISRALSQALFLFSGSFITATFYKILGDNNLESLSIMMGLCAYICAIAGVITASMLLYRMWKYIPETDRSISPGKAVGFLFIPVFHFYWIFRAIYGLSVATQRSINKNKAPQLLGLMFSIFVLLPPIALLVSIDIPNDLELELITKCIALGVGGAWLFFQSMAIAPQQSSTSKHALIGYEGSLLLMAVIALISVKNERAQEKESKAQSIAEACSSYCAVQELFSRRDRDGDGVREYATSFIMFYETRPGAADLQLITPQFALAEGAPDKHPQPHRGYCFKVLTAQGPYALGGSANYIGTDGNMTNGFALVAYPNDYRRSGRETFLVSHHGMIYRADLGRRTKEVVQNLTLFDPAPDRWQHYSMITPMEQLQP